MLIKTISINTILHDLKEYRVVSNKNNYAGTIEILSYVFLDKEKPRSIPQLNVNGTGDMSTTF